VLLAITGKILFDTIETPVPEEDLQTYRAGKSLSEKLGQL